MCGAVNVLESLRAICFRELGELYSPGEVTFNCPDPLSECVSIHIVKDDAVTCGGSDLSYTVAHRSCPNHGYCLNCLRIADCFQALPDSPVCRAARISKAASPWFDYSCIRSYTIRSTEKAIPLCA